MVDYTLEPLFHVGGTKKNWELEVTDGNNTYVFTNSDIVTESITILEKLFNITENDSITFGEFSTNEFRVKIGYVDNGNFVSLEGMTMTVKLWLNNYSGNKLEVGTYTIVSDTITSDHKMREITAYDSLYKFNDGDIAKWYNALFGNDTTLNLHTIFNAFMDKMGITCDTSITDKVNVLVHKYEVSNLRPSDLLINICELWAVFPTIGRNGHLQLIAPGETTSGDGTYPSVTLYPGSNTYPYRGSGGYAEIGVNNYIPPCKSGNYTVQPITRVLIRDKDGYVVHQDGEQGNDYYIDNNFLTFGMTQAQLETVGSSFIVRANRISYRPYEVSTLGNPCYECGDTIKVVTPYGDVDSFIFARTLKGGQHLIDEFTAKGTKVRAEKVSTYKPSSGGGGGSSTLADLEDVNLDNPSDGQVLSYNATTHLWQNKTVSNGHNYSTTEQVVGSWIDGKPIYEKTFYIGALVNGTTWNNVPHGVPDLKLVVGISGCMKNTSDGRMYNIPTYRTGGTTGVSIGVDTANIYYMDNWFNTTSDAYITIQYTKTTD